MPNNIEQIWQWLGEVPDPEIPVISIVELGVVRKIHQTDEQIEVFITPTYTGCPAMSQFEADIVKCLKSKTSKKINVVKIYDEPWTTDWITEAGKEKLKQYGIAPPKSTADKTKTIQCPQCQSENTKMVSLFGSTSCKSLYQCDDCKEPFDYFKCI